MPKRIQLSRKKGYRKPEGAIVVARPSKWGNPYRVGEVVYGAELDRHEAVRLFRRWFPTERLDVSALRGHDLACWCPLDQPCHADVLLEIANGPA